MTALTGPQISLFVILIVAFALLLTERIRNDVVALLLILAMYVSPSSGRRRSWWPAAPCSRLAGPVSACFRSPRSDWRFRRVRGWNEFLVLLLLFFIVGIVTQFMSDAATTAIFAPVAVSLAAARGHAPEPYVVTVAMAAVASFLTLIGHHGNLLVYGPGRYQFSDFVKVGTPLTVLVAVVVAALAPMLWRG